MGLTQEGLKRATSRIALLPFFPAKDDSARAVVMEELLSMCESDAHAQWLAIRMGQVFQKQWPGIGEMRALYCKRFKPVDHIQAFSEIYLDGFPSEQDLGVLKIDGLPEPIPALAFVSKKQERVAAAESKLLLEGLVESTEFPK